MKPIHQDETQNRKHAGKWLVGLTGGIGSGKTTVAECFQDRGIVVIDSDEIAHRITAPGGAAMAAIASAFGSQVVAAGFPSGPWTVRLTASACASLFLRIPNSASDLSRSCTR